MITINITRSTRTFTLHATGRRGYPGHGVPAGGLTGQILQKSSNADYDGEWADKTAIDGSLSLIYAIVFGL